MRLEEVFRDRAKKWKEFYTKPGKNEETTRVERNFSKKRWEETDDQFLDSVERATVESGVDRQKLMEYITIIDEDHHKYDPKIEKVLLVPLYIKLREMGYTHADLVI